MIYWARKPFIPILSGLSNVVAGGMVPVAKSMLAPGSGGVIVAEINLFNRILSPSDISITTCVAACK